MGLFKRIFGGTNDTPLIGDEWEGYSVNYSEEMPDPGIYLDLDANVMSLVVEVTGASEEKARDFADSLENTNIESVTFRGSNPDGSEMNYTLASGAGGPPTDGDDPRGDVDG